MAERARILVIEHRPEIGQLVELTLRDEGYDVETLVSPHDVVGEVRDRRPDLLIMDLLPYEDDVFAVLDALRVDEATRAVPVIAMTTSERAADAARASYNVRESLTKPFDLEALLVAVRISLRAPRMHFSIAPPTGPAGALALAERIVAMRSREAIFRWLQRLQQEPPWSERTDLGLGEVVDHAPVLLRALDAELHYGSSEAFFEAQPDALEGVRAHARVRREQRIMLTAVVHEYSLLRSEIWRLFRQHLPQQSATADILHLEEVVNSMLDRILEETIRTYLEAGE
jgi:CheY-like chemotaxis protein